MPIIRIELIEGRTSIQKKELVEVLTRETARIAGPPPKQSPRSSPSS